MCIREKEKYKHNGRMENRKGFRNRKKDKKSKNKFLHNEDVYKRRKHGNRLKRK